MKHLHSLAKSFLEFETLSGDDVINLIKKGKLKNKDKIVITNQTVLKHHFQ